MGRGEARAPSFDLVVSSTNPALGEEVMLAVKPEDNRTYSWFDNEVALNDLQYLNRSTIRLKTNTANSRVIRVVDRHERGRSLTKHYHYSKGRRKNQPIFDY